MIQTIVIMLVLLLIIIINMSYKISRYEDRLKNKDHMVNKLLQCLPYLFVDHLKDPNTKNIDGAYCFNMKVRPEYDSNHIRITFFIAGAKRKEYVTALYRYFSAVQLTKDVEMHITHLKDMDEVMIESRYEFDDEYHNSNHGVTKDVLSYPKQLHE